MRYLIAAVAVVGLFASPALASEATMKSCAAAWTAMSTADKAKTTYKNYTTACLKNGGPQAAAPVGATALCKDGTYYKNKVHSGACSGHGGVVKWL